MSAKVIYQPRPRFAIETGTVEVTYSDGSETIDWEFHSACDDANLAVLVADKLAQGHRHVRVVDRGAE